MAETINMLAELPPTKRKLVEAAMKLMLAKGYTATTVDQVCEEARVTKGSFFHYFKDKDAIAKTALDAFCSTQCCAIQSAELEKVKDPLERLEALLDTFICMSQDEDCPRSCLIGNFTQELAPTQPEMRTHVMTHVVGFTSMVQAMLDEAKGAHPPKIPFNSKSLADYFFALTQGSLILAKASNDSKPIKENIECFRQHVRLLFGTTAAKGKATKRK